MNKHIRILGGYSLKGLFELPRNGHQQEWDAIQEARRNGIFSSPIKVKGGGTRVLEFKNDLKCMDGTCKPYTDAFCTTAEDGSCSAMSSP